MQTKRTRVTLKRLSFWTLIALLGALGGGCGNNPDGEVDTDGGPGGATPSPTAQLSEALACDGGAGPDTRLGSITGPGVIAPLVTAAFKARVVEDAATWVGCGPGGARFQVDGGQWAGVTFPSVGLWRLTAITGDTPRAQGEFEVQALPGDVVRFDVDQLSLGRTPHDLGSVPWPSEVYRDATHGRILLSELSIRGVVPDALYSIVDFMSLGIQKGWTTMNGFSTVGALYARTEETASTDVLDSLGGPDALTLQGAPIFLLELEDGVVRPDSPRIPLRWRYVSSYSADINASDDPTSPSETVFFERDGLNMWLPDGQLFKEDTEYLWVITTGMGGRRGPWMASEGFTEFLNFPRGGEAPEVTELREKIFAAVDTQVDLPDIGVVAGASWFRTQRFTHQLDAIESCSFDGLCGGIDFGDADGLPAPRPSFDDDHVYWATPPDTTAGANQRRIADLMDYPGLIDSCDRLYPPETYAMVAFGSVTAPMWQGDEKAPVVDTKVPLKDLIQEDSEGRVLYRGTHELKFTLVIPTAPPAGGASAYPVVIFVHGLSQDQSDVFKVAEYLAAQGVALMAVDQVAHGSRYPTEEGRQDVINNTWMREADLLETRGLVDDAAALRAAAIEEPWALTGDGLADAKVLGGYEVVSVLSFFEGLANAKAMGDNFRQLSSDLMQLERMLTQGNGPGGLIRTLGGWDSTMAPLSTGKPMFHGRSLGSIALGTHLGALRDERVAVLGVPGAGVGTQLAAYSPFVGSILVLAEDVLSCLPNCALVEDGTPELPVPEAELYMAPGDPFTHLFQGLLEAGDPLALAQRHQRGNRSGPAHLLLQHACDDEVVPNIATEVWAATSGFQSLAAVDVSPLVTPATPDDGPSYYPAYYVAQDDKPPGCEAPEGAPPEVGRRSSVQGNVEGATQVVLTYCPGTHAGIYDRPSVADESYGYYPDGPFPHGAAKVFPTLTARLPVVNPHYAAREAAVEFLLSATRGTPVAVAPAPPQLDDLDSDGVSEPQDPCPLGPNPLFWEAGGGGCP